MSDFSTLTPAEEAAFASEVWSRVKSDPEKAYNDFPLAAAGVPYITAQPAFNYTTGAEDAKYVRIEMRPTPDGPLIIGFDLKGDSSEPQEAFNARVEVITNQLRGVYRTQFDQNEEATRRFEALPEYLRDYARFLQKVL